jgi:hypothetical protein
VEIERLDPSLLELLEDDIEGTCGWGGATAGLASAASLGPFTSQFGPAAAAAPGGRGLDGEEGGGWGALGMLGRRPAGDGSEGWPATHRLPPPVA